MSPTLGPGQVAADAEEDEADAEHEREEHEHPLRLLPQAREEHALLGYGAAAAAAAAGGPAVSRRLLALAAFLRSSCHSILSSLVPDLAVDDRENDALRGAAEDDGRRRILPW